MKELLLEPRPSDPRRLLPAAKALSFLLALSVLATAMLLAFAALDYRWDWEPIWRNRSKFLQGWTVTLVLSVASLALSLVIGSVTALACSSRILPLRYLFKVYVELTRGAPLLAQVLIYNYVVATAIGVNSRYLVGIVALSLFGGAYIAEIFRAGIESVGKSQLLSAQAIGLTPYQTFKHVILPQAARRSLPALAGQFANLIKDSSLLSIIAISELTLNFQEVNATTFKAFEAFVPLVVGYLILTLPVMQLSRHIERQLRFDT